VVDFVRASVLTAPKTMVVQEFPRPAVTAETALLRVEAAGLCGSDIEEYNGTAPIGVMPCIPGHETVGIIEEIGDVGAASWNVGVGDRVAVEFANTCGACIACREGKPFLCRAPDHSKIYGFRSTEDGPGLWGGYAEYMYLHGDSIVHRISPDLPPEVAVMFNPLAGGIQWAVLDGGVGLGDTVVVLGSGQRGLCAAVAAKAAGAGSIIVSDLAKARAKLDLALEFGADHVVTADTEDIVERVREITGSQMADVVVDVAAGSTQTPLDALRLARRGGTVVLAGSKPDPPTFPIYQIQASHKNPCGRRSR
jgi:threonine dehydrogenase-like Zn-dependent dehydrogenase